MCVRKEHVFLILCVEYKAIYITYILVLFFLSLYIFAVSQKINLLNKLTRQSSTGSNNGGMNNQRTLDLIRDDLGHLVEAEGTYWDTRHPHIFVVMGASVSHIIRTFLFSATKGNLFYLGRFGKKENLSNLVVAV